MIGIVTVKTFLEMRLSEIILILDQMIFLVNVQKKRDHFLLISLDTLKIYGVVTWPVI